MKTPEAEEGPRIPVGHLALALVPLCMLGCSGATGAQDVTKSQDVSLEVTADARTPEDTLLGVDKPDRAADTAADSVDAQAELVQEPCTDTDPTICPVALALFCDGLVVSETSEAATIAYYVEGDTFFLTLEGMGGYWQPGDIEATRFDAAHPFVLKSIRVLFSQPGPAEIHLWADLGGSWPDRSVDLAGPFLVEVPAEGWTDIPVEPPLEILPYQRIWVGLVHDDSPMTIAIDEGDPFLLQPDLESWAATNRTKVWTQWYVEAMDGQGEWQWISSPYTHFIQLQGHYLCRAEQTDFSDATAQAGLDQVYMTRVSWADFTGDGFDDMMIHNHRFSDQPGQRVFSNNGDGTFADISGAAGLAGRGSNLVTFADVDNDRDQDALLSVYYDLETDPNPAFQDALMLNDGAGNFTEKEDADVANGSTTATAGFADFDADGWLDIFAGNTRHHGEDQAYDQAMRDVLQRNLGDATFLDVTESAGLGYQPSSQYPFNPDYFTLTNGMVWTDYNGDGLIDIYVANYGLTANFLWENQGDGTFKETARFRNLHADDEDGNWAAGTSFGAHFADYDNDGDQDLFQTEICHPRYLKWGSDRSSLRRNPGGPAPFFEIVTEASGIVWNEGDYEASWVDFDNDGLLDLFISSVYGLMYARLYRQNPDHTFTDWSYLAGIRIMNAKSHAWADFDRDGDLDLVVGSRQPETPMRLYRNEVGQDNAWLSVELEGDTDNRTGVGARVAAASSDGLIQTREVRAGGGHTRQDSLAVEFGFGSNVDPVDLTVHWPSGATDFYPAVPVDQFVTLVQNESQPRPR